jgi:hypothetical protein
MGGKKWAEDCIGHHCCGTVPLLEATESLSQCPGVLPKTVILTEFKESDDWISCNLISTIISCNTNKEKQYCLLSC